MVVADLAMAVSPTTRQEQTNLATQFVSTPVNMQSANYALSLPSHGHVSGI